MRTLVDDYHIFYELTRIWEKNTWLGIPMWKFPCDAFVVQELIYKIQPDWIIETGTGHGGSAVFYASIFELIDHGKVITIDIEHKYDFDTLPRKIKNRIIFEGGGSTNPLIFKRIEEMVKGKKNLIMLDSWHTKEHVLEELKLYSPLVSFGSYLIVEDTHAGKKGSGHPIEWKWDSDGAYEAVEEFLKSHDEFQPDYECEKHLLTFNPRGFLKKIKV